MPPAAVAAGIDGAISFLITVDKTGVATKALVLSGPAWPCGKDEPTSELELVRKSVSDILLAAKYSPAMKKGQPVEDKFLLDYAISETFRNGNASNAGGKPGIVYRGDLTGKALVSPRPKYPAGAKLQGLAGIVKMLVIYDEKGDVILAGPIVESKGFVETARTAACATKFRPFKLDGTPVKASGFINYIISLPF